MKDIDLLEEERFKKLRKRRLRSMNIITLASCNYACGMCPYYGDGYSGEYFKERQSIKRNMNLDELKVILDKAKKQEIEWIDLTPNGEFFVHKEWREILKVIKSYGFKIYLTTNGGLLSEEDIKEVCKIGIDHVVVSIDSVRYEFYKIIRKPATEKAFQNAINSPKLFKKYSPKTYVQVQITEQPEMPDNNPNEVLEYYRDTPLNQININKMFLGSSDGMMHFGAEKGRYIHGTCNGYGNPIVLPDGKVLPCCGGFYFYPKIEDKIPILFSAKELDFLHKEWSLHDAIEHLDNLYQYDKTFRNYCENCSLYDSGSTKIERAFVSNGYFATQLSIRTRYYLLPKYLRPLPEKIVLWLYKNGYARKIKNFLTKLEG